MCKKTFNDILLYTWWGNFSGCCHFYDSQKNSHCVFVKNVFCLSILILSVQQMAIILSPLAKIHPSQCHKHSFSCHFYTHKIQWCCQIHSFHDKNWLCICMNLWDVAVLELESRHDHNRYQTTQLHWSEDPSHRSYPYYIEDNQLFVCPNCAW